MDGEKLAIDFDDKIFSWLSHMYSEPQKKLGEKPNLKFFMMAQYVAVISEILQKSPKWDILCLKT